MTYVDLRPDETRPVRVPVDGTWRDGELEAYRREVDGAWHGWVRWSEGVGLNHLDWFKEDALQAEPGVGTRSVLPEARGTG